MYSQVCFFRSRPYGVRCMTVGKWLLLKLSALKSKYITLSITIQNDSRFSATGFLTSFLALMAPFSTLFFSSNHHSISRKTVSFLWLPTIWRDFFFQRIFFVNKFSTLFLSTVWSRQTLNCVAQLAPCALVLFSFVLILICCSVPSLAARQMCEYQGYII